MHLRTLPLLLLIALPAVGANVSAAPPAGQQAAPRDGRRIDNALSDSVRRIERSTRGQILSAEQVPYDGRSVNRIKVVDERGRVRVYMDDPRLPQPQPVDPPTRGDDD